MQLRCTSHISHSLLVVQLFLPCDTVLNPIAAAGASAQVLLLPVLISVCRHHTAVFEPAAHHLLHALLPRTQYPCNISRCMVVLVPIHFTPYQVLCTPKHVLCDVLHHPVKCVEPEQLKVIVTEDHKCPADCKHAASCPHLSVQTPHQGCTSFCAAGRPHQGLFGLGWPTVA